MEEVIPQLGDEIPEDWMKKYQQETRSKTRTITVANFRGQDSVDIQIFHPNQGVETEAQNIYTKVYGNLIKDPDYMTRKEALKVFKERGVWGDEEENRLEEISEEMKDLEIQSALFKKNKGDKNKIKKIKEKWLDLKKQSDALISERSNLLINTIESRASEMETKVRLSRCVKFTDGTPVWENIEALDNDEDSQAVRKIVDQSLRFWFGLAQEIINDLPAILFGGEEDQKNEPVSEISGDVSVDD